MPFATFARVREVSSEDNVHCAENLIKSQSGKKWKTKNVGEKSAYVILEMSDSYQITGIDIGNEHSAFVEVLVGKSSCAPEDFTEILITCSFMTPIESKNSTNINRVRCFNHEALVPTVAEGKWSLVKILCTQPFNKHVSYGLSFIKIHISDNVKNNSTIQNSPIPKQVQDKTTENCGKLKFREDSPDSEEENSSSLFSRWKKSKANIEEQTTAASIRMASKNLSALEIRRLSDNDRAKCSTPKINEKYLDRNRENLLFGDESDDDSSNNNSKKLERLSEQIEADKKRRRQEKENETMNKKARKSLDCSPKSVAELKPKPTSSTTSERNITNLSLENSKKTSNSSKENSIKKIKSSVKVKPFNQLLNGVVLVISGIQNPDRADLRSKALALGAKYKADWDNTCTHLICAFKNTPKYNQVKGKGKIVTRSWIEKCFSLKKYLPWRRYALDSKDLSQPESDEEIFSTAQTPEDDDSDNSTETRKRRKSEERRNMLALYDLDEKSNDNHSEENSHHNLPSESENDEGLERTSKNNMVQDAKTDKKSPDSKKLDIYEVSTDEEDYIAEKLSKE